jgi:hypothetical protein
MQPGAGTDLPTVVVSSAVLAATLAVTCAVAAALVGVGAAVEAAATTDGTDTDGPTAAAARTTPSATATNLSSTLVRLARADDPASFAAAHGIEYADGRALVVVELRGASSLPAGYDATVQQTVTVDGQTVVQALVPVDRLLALAEEPSVAYVRLPERAVPGNTEERTEATVPGSTASDRTTSLRTAGDAPAGRGTDVLLFVGAVGLAALAVGLYGRRRR